MSSPSRRSVIAGLATGAAATILPLDGLPVRPIQAVPLSIGAQQDALFVQFARHTMYAQLRAHGMMTVAEVRHAEGLPPV